MIPAENAPIRTLIVDDERLARATLRSLLDADPEIDVAGECKNGREAVASIRESAPDLVFLDVQMPGMDGFQVLERARPARMPAVVFVTAYDAHALRAFEVHALDYLLKPFDDERFDRALRRAKDHIRKGRVEDLTRRLVALFGAAATPALTAPPAAPPPPPPAAQATPYLDRIALKEGRRVTFLPVDEIDWIEAEDYYAEIHTRGRSHLLREPLRDLEARLDPRRFVRIHRSTIVNVARVRELQPLFHGEAAVILHDGTQLKLSRTRREPLLALLGLS